MQPAFDFGSEKLKAEFKDTWMEERKKRGAMGDCSLLVWRMCFRCGKLYTRTTAKAMAKGEGNWKGKDVAFAVAKACSIPFFTFTEDRENGHTGLLLKATRGFINRLAHASSKANKFMEVEIAAGKGNTFHIHLTTVRELD